MWWRIKRSQFEAQQGDDNRAAFRQIVARGDVPGILAYHEGKPVGWCAVQPREAYPVLQRSPTLKPVDDRPVWSIPCFFVARAYRRSGVMAALLRAAVDHAARHGARLVEGYPVEPRSENAPDLYVFTGFAATFKEAGFVEVARRSATRPIMRYVIPAEQVGRGQG
jgi:GNAT superfamily N-acetyltransferase